MNTNEEKKRLTNKLQRDRSVPTSMALLLQSRLGVICVPDFTDLSEVRYVPHICFPTEYIKQLCYKRITASASQLKEG